MARKLGWSSSAVAGQGPNSVNSSGFTLALTDTERAHAWKAGPQTSSQSHDTLLHYLATHYTSCKATLSRLALEFLRLFFFSPPTKKRAPLNPEERNCSAEYPIEMSLVQNTSRPLYIILVINPVIMFHLHVHCTLKSRNCLHWPGTLLNSRGGTVQALSAADREEHRHFWERARWKGIAVERERESTPPEMKG